MFRYAIFAFSLCLSLNAACDGEIDKIVEGRKVIGNQNWLAKYDVPPVSEKGTRVLRDGALEIESTQMKHADGSLTIINKYGSDSEGRKIFRNKITATPSQDRIMEAFIGIEQVAHILRVDANEKTLSVDRLSIGPPVRVEEFSAKRVATICGKDCSIGDTAPKLYRHEYGMPATYSSDLFPTIVLDPLGIHYTPANYTGERTASEVQRWADRKGVVVFTDPFGARVEMNTKDGVLDGPFSMFAGNGILHGHFTQGKPSGNWAPEYAASINAPKWKVVNVSTDRDGAFHAQKMAAHFTESDGTEVWTSGSLRNGKLTGTQASIKRPKHFEDDQTPEIQITGYVYGVAKAQEADESVVKEVETEAKKTLKTK